MRNPNWGRDDDRDERDPVYEGEWRGGGRRFVERGREGGNSFAAGPSQSPGSDFPQPSEDHRPYGPPSGYGSASNRSGARAGRAPSPSGPFPDHGDPSRSSGGPGQYVEQGSTFDSHGQFYGTHGQGNPWSGGNQGNQWSGGEGSGDRGQRAPESYGAPHRYGGVGGPWGGTSGSYGGMGGGMGSMAGEYGGQTRPYGAQPQTYGGRTGRSTGWEPRPGEFTGRGPKGYRRSDDRIREEVCDCLTEDGGIDASEIEITVADGEVTISGTVPSRRTKRDVEELCEGFAGVKDVHNNLRVRTSGESSEPSSSNREPSSSHESETAGSAPAKSPSRGVAESSTPGSATSRSRV